MSRIPPSSFVDAAKALAPQIHQLAGEIEQSRRLPMPLVESMAGAGLFRLWIPRSLGGEETDPMTLARVIEEVLARRWSRRLVPGDRGRVRRFRRLSPAGSCT